MISAKTIKKYAQQNFSRFGVNKQAQITRLLYEIAKREKLSFKDLSRTFTQDSSKFSEIKQDLIQRRYPRALASAEPLNPYLPELKVIGRYKLEIKKRGIVPKNIFVEEEARDSYLVRRFRERFPRANFTGIASLKEYVQGRRFNPADYNKRGDNFFIVREKHDFFKRCPCTAAAVSCGYHIFNLGFGCLFDCAYCYLQQYANVAGIIIPANIEDYFRAFRRYRHNIRLGTGEFTDSLMLDDITEFSPQLVEFFKGYPKCVFELKTKSDNIDTLTQAAAGKNIVVAWSLNPDRLIAENEFYCPTLARRLEAAARCAACGFNVAFHFDPIIYYAGWEKDYSNAVNRLFDKVGAGYIRWISLGTLRFAPQVKKTIENRFPQNSILDAELLLDFDAKLRYTAGVRLEIYTKMLRWIRRRSPRVLVYLCMEQRRLWQELRPLLGRTGDPARCASLLRSSRS